MQYETDVVFVPEDFCGESPSSARCSRIAHTEKISSTERKRRGKEKAINTNLIDEYAIRNYWKIAGGETRLEHEAFDTINELEKQLQGINQVKSSRKRSNTTEKSILLVAEDTTSVQTVLNKIQSTYEMNHVPPTRGTSIQLPVVRRWSSDYKFSIIEDCIEAEY